MRFYIYNYIYITTFLVKYCKITTFFSLPQVIALSLDTTHTKYAVSPLLIHAI